MSNNAEHRRGSFFRAPVYERWPSRKLRILTRVIFWSIAVGACLIVLAETSGCTPHVRCTDN